MQLRGPRERAAEVGNLGYGVYATDGLYSYMGGQF